MNYDDNYEDEAFQTLTPFCACRPAESEYPEPVDHFLYNIHGLPTSVRISVFLLFIWKLRCHRSAAGPVDPDRRHCTDHDHLHLPQYFQSDSAYDRDLSEYL